jgi:hypothetical protein
MALRNQVKENERINGDRRHDRRYQIPLELRWKLIRRRKLLSSGEGQTLDISSGGILFDARRTMPEGLDIELSIAWPVLLNNVAAMQLVVSGRIVRANGNSIAIRTVQHEFRTVGAAAESRRGTGPVLTPPMVIPNRRAATVETSQ